LNECDVKNVRQAEILPAESPVPWPSAFGVEITTENVKDINNHVLIKFRYNLFKKEVEQYVLDP
jgi:hypothetical protein